MKNTVRENARIMPGGAGGFLNPPGHPEHDYHVETDLSRRPENRGMMSLSSAAESEWLKEEAPAAVERAAALLAAWEQMKLPLAHPAVKDWLAQVLGYFRGCYKAPGLPEPDCWNASKLLIVRDKAQEVQMSWDDHAGVHLIRKYYPQYTPAAEDFARAYWGMKPAAKI